MQAALRGEIKREWAPEVWLFGCRFRWSSWYRKKRALAEERLRRGVEIEFGEIEQIERNKGPG